MPAGMDAANAPVVWMFAAHGCGFCRRAQQLLRDTRCPFSVVYITDHPELRPLMEQLSDRHTVPQVFVRNDLVGGFDDLKREHDAGKLQQRIQHAADGTAFQPPLPRGTWTTVVPDDGLAGHPGRDAPMHASGSGSALASAGVSGPTALLRRLDPRAWLGGAAGGELAASTPASSSSLDALDLAAQSGSPYSMNPFARTPPLNDLQLPHTGILSAGAPRLAGAGAVSDVRHCMLRLHDEALSADGLAFDYERARRSRALWDYMAAVRRLRHLDLRRLSEATVVAMFINLYNSLMVHALIAYGPPRNALQRLQLFRHASYRVAGHSFSLNDMEHGVLRGNRRAPLTLRPQFGQSDPRLALAVSRVDPRIHFALNCGARSCPAIKVYDAATLDADLTLAAKGFLQEPTAFAVVGNEVHLSKIFQWYAADFGASDQDIVRWCLPFLRGDVAEAASRALLSGAMRLAYLPYDWGMNGPREP